MWNQYALLEKDVRSKNEKVIHMQRLLDDARALAAETEQRTRVSELLKTREVQCVEAANNSLEIQLRLARSEAAVEIKAFKHDNGRETVALRKEVTALRKESARLKLQGDAKAALISKLQNETELMRGMLMNKQQLRAHVDGGADAERPRTPIDSAAAADAVPASPHKPHAPPPSLERLADLTAAKTRSPRVRFLSDQDDLGPVSRAHSAAAPDTAPQLLQQRSPFMRSVSLPVDGAESAADAEEPLDDPTDSGQPSPAEVWENSVLGEEAECMQTPAPPDAMNVTGYGTQKGSITERCVT